ncbi:MAG: hypothetical protein WC122_01230 [archaeon]
MLKKNTDHKLLQQYRELIDDMKRMNEIPNQEYRDRFRSMNDKQLIDAFNNEVGNSGWTASRASYLFALCGEFKNRDYDYSNIGEEKVMSLNKKIKLINKKIIVDEK